MTDPRNNFRAIAGSASVLVSAFCFYLSTATIRWAQLQGVTLDPSFYVLTRFLLGFLLIGIILIYQQRPPKPANYHLLIGRAVANSVAVYCFYMAVKTTSVSHANILNMTYPVFVALLTWFFLPAQRDLRTIITLFIAFLGIVLILHPGEMRFNTYHLWGIGSGISAAFAIIYLNLSRKVHDSETVLFYMFGLGSVFIYTGFHQRMMINDPSDILFLLLCGAFGIAGQYFITFGFRHITAVEGSIISSTRILIAAIAGPLLAIDPAMTLRGWSGALLIFAANVYLAIRSSHPEQRHPKVQSGTGRRKL